MEWFIRVMLHRPRRNGGIRQKCSLENENNQLHRLEIACMRIFLFFSPQDKTWALGGPRFSPFFKRTFRSRLSHQRNLDLQPANVLQLRSA
jgi:hypothetical protein